LFWEASITVKKRELKAEHQSLTPIFLGTWEVEIQRIMV
jgi:hypothetical protein